MKSLSDLTGPGDIREQGIAVLLDEIERIVEFLDRYYGVSDGRDTYEGY